MERSFAEFVKSRLAELGMEQKELAKALGVTDAYISRILTGATRPPSDTRSKIVPKMQEILGFKKGELVRLAQMDRGTWQMAKARMEFPEMERDDFDFASKDRIQEPITEYSTAGAKGLDQIQTIPILTLEDIEKGLYNMLFARDLIAEDRETIPFAGLHKDEKAYGLLVPDRSMHPKLEMGDKLIVSPKAEVKEGDIAVCIMDSDILIRRVHFRGESVVLEPYDRSMKMLVLRKNEISEMHKVIHIILD